LIQVAQIFGFQVLAVQILDAKEKTLTIQKNPPLMFQMDNQ